MKLSENFVEVLKNFASINSGLIIKPGNVIRTISQNKTILARAVVDETFENEFGIYDLNKLLALLSLNKSALEVEIENESFVFLGLNGKGKIRQRFTDTKFIMGPPSKELKIEKFNVDLTLTQEIFDWVFNVSSILKCPNIVVAGEAGENITISAVDVKGEVVDSASVELGTVASANFKAVFKIDNLKVIPGEYTVQISKVGVSLFTHKTKKLQYWISIESKQSSFDAPQLLEEGVVGA
jgi:hypothetical protein